MKIFNIGEDGNEQVENTEYTWSELHREILSMVEEPLFNSRIRRFMIFEECLIFTNIKFDYWTTVSETTLLKVYRTRDGSR